MIDSAPTVTHLYAQAILQFADRRGLTIPLAIRNQVRPQQRVPLHVQDQLWEHYCRLADHPLAGLDIGMALEIGHLDSVGMLLASCDTLLDGFKALLEYTPVIGSGGSFKLVLEGDLIHLSYRPTYQICVSERVEAVMASLIKLARWASGHVFNPAELKLAHQPRTNSAVYQQRLFTPVHFAKNENALLFHRSQAELPLIQANRNLREHLQQLANHTLERLRQQSLSSKVTHLVSDNPAWGRERVAAALAFSGRHLNRLLAAEGVSFKVIRERELHRIAVERLQQGYSVSDTAAQLGFSEETALIRAFRRWEGETPARYREAYLRQKWHP